MDIALVQSVQRLRDAFLSHGESFHNRLDLVKRGELEHALVDTLGRGDGSLDCEAVDDHRHVGELELLGRDAEGEDDGPGGHDVDEELPVGQERSGN